MPHRKKQKCLTEFFVRSVGDAEKNSTAAVPNREKKERSLDWLKSSSRKRQNGSHFGNCPLCCGSFPLHQLEQHAASCNGIAQLACITKDEQNQDGSLSSCYKSKIALVDTRTGHTDEPIPGLFLFEDFVTEEEEAQILAEIDGRDKNHHQGDEFLPWKTSNFNGTHMGKRWGVHCNLRERRVTAAENPLPPFVRELLIPKLKELRSMAGCVPNEANAIDYRRKQGHYLKSHVDDRQLSKEPIANLSLAGDCYMTFENVAPGRNAAVRSKRVLLKRRCLQVLTGTARYDFSHGIEHDDLLSDRRVSVTMRESPLTKGTPRSSAFQSAMQSKAWWKMAAPKRPVPLANDCEILPTAEPIPGLFVFDEFITEKEEAAILMELDDPSKQSWKTERHTGTHREKRFGVDHDLWSRSVRAPKHDMPDCFDSILLPKLKRITAMAGCIPNDANAIDYQRRRGDSLAAHVDDRKKHKEPIANLSLAGACYMTFVNRVPHRNAAIREKRVYLGRRCLQVLTGKARYDYAHGIENTALLSERRVSVTLRETPPY